MRAELTSNGEPSQEAVRGALDRLLGSRAFVQSMRLSRFLRFGVEAALAGRTSINEYSIGIDVFEKKGNFDPRIDPIVRVHARRLRTKLTQYYETEGSEDPVEIGLPLRTYVPVFRTRPARSHLAKRPAAFRPQFEPAESVLVFPFASLSAAKEDDYFAEGLTRELIHALSTVKDWRVVAWHAGSWEQRLPDLRELGNQLNVAAALWGTVRKGQRMLRVSVELSSIPDRTVLCSQMYEVEADDLVAAQERLGRSICQALRTRATEQTAVPARVAASPEARKLHLQGRQSAGRRTVEGLEKSVRYLSRAVAADPGYAEGYASLAEALVLMATDADWPPLEVMPKAAQAAARAVECDATLAEGRMGIGLVAALYECDLARAESEFRQAIELNPGPQVLAWYAATCLTPAARFQEAIACLERAQELDPVSPVVQSHLAYSFCAAGFPDRALDPLLESLDIEHDFPLTHWSLGLAYLCKSQFDKAILQFEEGVRLSHGVSNYQAALGHAYALAGDGSRAAAALERLRNKAREAFVPAIDIALIHLGLNEYDEAFRYLENAAEQKCAWRHRLAVDPRIRASRADARIARIIQNKAELLTSPAAG